MGTLIAKKIGLFAIYFVLTSLLDQIFGMFTPHPLFSFLASALVICAASYYLRVSYIKKCNYGEETRKAYNETLQSKCRFIVTSKPFIVEIAMAVIISIFFALVPRAAISLSYAFTMLYISRFLMIILFAAFVIADFVVWFLAYKKCFGIKKY